MAATFQVVELNGAGPDETVVTTIRYCLADSVDPGTANPCVVPNSGLYYSWWKHHVVKFSGSFTTISNIRWYSSGNPSWSLGTNGKVVVGVRDTGDNGCPTANYEQAAGSGNTGYVLDNATSGHDYYKDQTDPYNQVGDYTESAKLTVDSTEYSSAGRSHSVVTQVFIDDDATQGEKSDTTFYFLVDEV